jgi:hypothetical protein
VGSPDKASSRIRRATSIAWKFAFGPGPATPLPPSRVVRVTVNLAPFVLIGLGIWRVFGDGWGLVAAGALLYHDAIRPVLARRRS